MKKKINILGTEYTIEERTMAEDKLLEECDGYCDKTTKEIVVTVFDDKEYTLHNPEWYIKKVTRHEIIHAFLFESGLHESLNNEGGHDEQMVDWFAVQSPKIFKAFEQVGCM